MSLTKLMTLSDVWGNYRRVRVTWKPLDVTHTDPAFENIGMKKAIWDSLDDPPVFVVYAHEINEETLDPARRRAGGEVFEAVEVDKLYKLQEGCYHLEWL
ncbi:hypothetical protein [Corynebacterium ulcerans]|uniref:hypothetical protein n=1 Tax=Corynebacterium ulcerans TaxID=65058 RepID=UPI0018D5EC92|nr:hypothetical protein [Corynebacterium ulcerans]MBH5296178.1 hypothetical protein [Corynebacterium ulcerans]